MMNNNLFISHYQKNRVLREIIEWMKAFIITITVTLFVFGNIFSITGIKGSSMEPTFLDGERVFNYKLGYYFTEPKRGDVVILSKSYSDKGLIINTITEAKDIINNISNIIRKNTEVKYIVKRVIGIPGDTIDIIDGNVYVNGRKLKENYIKGRTFKSLEISYPIIVPENKVFV